MVELFITFEGLDGAGKSTQIRLLVSKLESEGQIVVCTREPGGTAIGDALRSILLNPNNADCADRAEALMYAASRAQLVDTVIKPALEAGWIVLCDRYVDASMAYQGAGLGIDEADVRQINAFATQGLVPQLTFLFDLPVLVSRERVTGHRGEGGRDRIERRDEHYFARVRDAFLAIAAAEPDRVKVLDATQPPHLLEQEIWAAVTKLIQPTAKN